jgi:hypothetical protein
MLPATLEMRWDVCIPHCSTLPIPGMYMSNAVYYEHPAAWMMVVEVVKYLSMAGVQVFILMFAD